MNPTRYTQAFKNHRGKVSDKWSSYLQNYDRITQYLEAKNILEIGVQNGGSLEIWNDIYPDAENIVGVDTNDSCSRLVFDSEIFTLVIADAGKHEIVQYLKDVSNSFDLIVDDGSHQNLDIVSSLVYLLPMLDSNGFYVIEDISTSYWPSWGGSLYRHESAMNFLYRIADAINHEHWRVTEGLREYLACPIEMSDDFLEAVKRIRSISFQNSFVVIEMLSEGEVSSIGLRVQAGVETPVDDSMLRLSGLPISHDSFDGEVRESKSDPSAN